MFYYPRVGCTFRLWRNMRWHGIFFIKCYSWKYVISLYFEVWNKEKFIQPNANLYSKPQSFKSFYLLKAIAWTVSYQTRKLDVWENVDTILFFSVLILNVLSVLLLTDAFLNFYRLQYFIWNLTFRVKRDVSEWNPNNSFGAFHCNKFPYYIKNLPVAKMTPAFKSWSSNSVAEVQSNCFTKTSDVFVWEFWQPR